MAASFDGTQLNFYNTEQKKPLAILVTECKLHLWMIQKLRFRISLASIF